MTTATAARFSADDLDATFAALADRTRRAMVAKLARGEASVLELAEPHDMSQPAISKHLKVLERAGLITRGRDAQRRPCRLEPRRLKLVADWIATYREYWEESYARLDDVLQELQGQTPTKQKKRKRRGPMPTSRKLEVIAAPDKPTIVTRRTFDAPRALVFDAWTKAEYIKRWMGPRNMEMVVCEIDLRVGGGYRFVHRTPDGQEFGIHGTYREISRPDRLVSTYVFELFPDAESLETLVLEERDGQTTAITTTVHKTIQNRDGHLANGAMEVGMNEGYARLDELLPDLKRAPPETGARANLEVARGRRAAKPRDTRAQRTTGWDAQNGARQKFGAQLAAHAPAGARPAGRSSSTRCRSRTGRRPPA